MSKNKRLWLHCRGCDGRFSVLSADSPPYSCPDCYSASGVVVSQSQRPLERIRFPRPRGLTDVKHPLTFLAVALFCLSAGTAEAGPLTDRAVALTVGATQAPTPAVGPMPSHQRSMGRTIGGIALMGAGGVWLGVMKKNCDGVGFELFGSDRCIGSQSVPKGQVIGAAAMIGVGALLSTVFSDVDVSASRTGIRW